MSSMFEQKSGNGQTGLQVTSAKRASQANRATVPDKNSYDTSTEHCFSLLARLLVFPMLFIAVSSPNLADQHWESKKTGKCPYDETETYSPVTAILYLHCI